jgi:phosphoribosylaminoimidazolecarboxamide formyltransferase/IMP cyclohydrolase
MALDVVPIKRALISVYDKEGLKDLAEMLSKGGVEILSTGGTEKQLQSWEIKTVSVSSYTGFPEILEGRVKTLHPKIAGGILARREDPGQMREIQEKGIGLIDLVVVNLYPFEKTWESKAAPAEMLENIDIGGPSLIRAAAKNYASVAVVTSPEQYQEIVNELKDKGGISLVTREKLARKAFEYTAYYDGVIARYFQESSKSEEKFSENFNYSVKRAFPLRYGENPHQEAYLYKLHPVVGSSVINSKTLSGKELSYNNILDLEATFNLMIEFDKPFAAIIKHNNPCGAACAETLANAYFDAYEGDPVSAYGGIVGLNRKVDLETAQKINDTLFVECIIAPDYEEKALGLLMTKKNRRILACGELRDLQPGLEFRILRGGALIQTSDVITEQPSDFKTVTESKPNPEQMKSLWFTWKICRHVKSNAIVICQGDKTVGIGGGQTSRVESVIIAARKAGERAKGGVLASDAFFPMRDGIDEAAKAGVTAIIQPGGSKRDEECIRAANEHGMAMVFTGVRHFRH